MPQKISPFYVDLFITFENAKDEKGEKLQHHGSGIMISKIHILTCAHIFYPYTGKNKYVKDKYNQTLRVFHLSYFKYVLQISFNSFQFISSKFWKSVIFNLFEVSFLISNEINFLNKFFSEIFMITSIITYSRTTDYLFFILSGKWVHDFWYQLFIFLYF